MTKKPVIEKSELVYKEAELGSQNVITASKKFSKVY